MNFDVTYIVQLVIGAVMPWLVQITQKTGWAWLQNPRLIQLTVGVIGVVTAFVSDLILSNIGLTQSKTVSELALIGFGITMPTSELSYRTFIKKKQDA